MSTSVKQCMSYLLVDGALLGAVLEELLPAGDAPPWLHTIYLGEDVRFGPLLVDVEAVHRHDAADGMMALVNGRRPQLHLSYIESALPVDQLVVHLQQFRAIHTTDGRLFTLRFADNVALSSLAAVLLPAQWNALMGPIARWWVHGRDGATRQLSPAKTLDPPAQPPLTLSEAQLAELDELCAPDVMLAHIRDIRHGEPLPGSAGEQHRWACESRRAWQAAGKQDLIVLRWLTSAALDTAGAVLAASALPEMLAEPDLTKLKTRLLAHVRAIVRHMNPSIEGTPVLSD